MMILLINKDNTVNYMAYELPDEVHLTGVDVIEIEGSFEEIKKNIPNEFCIFDWEGGCVKDIRDNDHLLLQRMSESGKKDYQKLKRASLLVQIDNLVSNPLRYESMSNEVKSTISDYRKDLLDITEQSTFPHHVTWPETPRILKEN